MRIGERNSDLVAAARAWQATHRWPEPGTYEQEVDPVSRACPRLQSLARQGFPAATAS
jgi:hypothetical protein